jgi:thymidylate synthase
MSVYTNENEYLELLQKILKYGKTRKDRTGTGTLSIFGSQLRFDISKNVPLLTTKFVAWKAVIKELLWFLRGETDSKILESQGVKIWQGNTTRDFLDNRGLIHLPEGDIGAGYGFQWRYFGAEYTHCKDDYTFQGYDQIASIIHQLKNDPYSRRIFMSAWNPIALDGMALPPCHVSCQFYVEEDEKGNRHLSCHMYQRSVDVFLGLPFNIFSSTVLTYILAKMCGMIPKELIISTGDTHIYKNHLDQIKTQLSRDLKSPPVLKINRELNDITDIERLTIEDFELENYIYHPAIKGDMAI